MRPSDPVRPGPYSTPDAPFADHAGWHITRYADIEAAIQLEQQGMLSSDFSFVRAAVAKFGVQLPDRVLALFYFPWGTGPVKADGSPGRHEFLRTLLKESLTQNKIAGLAGFIERFALKLVRENVEKHLATRSSTQGVIDLAHFADRLAFHAIAELAGFPHEIEDERFMLQHLRDLSNRAGFLDAFAPEPYEVREYIWHAVQQEKKPGSLLERAATAHEQGHIDSNELIGLILGSWVAGRETTATLVAMALGLSSAAHIHARKLAEAGHNGNALRQQVIEETLRLATPFPASARVSTQDVTIGGQHIPALSLLNLRWEAANRDKDIFGQNAHEFRPERTTAGHHVTFGRGLHYCLGASLGRMEADIALRVVYQILGELRIVDWQRQAAFADTVSKALATYRLTTASRGLILYS